MSLRVLIELLNGQTLALLLLPEMTVRELKKQIKDRQSWEDEVRRDTTVVDLIFEERKLKNDEMVADLGLNSESKVSAVFRQNLVRCSDKDELSRRADLELEELVAVEFHGTETAVAPMAFAGCQRLASVIIPESVTRIEDAAFHGCSFLRSVTISDSVTHIGMGAFYHCTSLSSITIPESVTHIGNGAFTCCSSLSSVHMPDYAVTQIGRGAFAGCPWRLIRLVQEHGRGAQVLRGLPKS